jgi:hypothetical protein
MHYHVEARGFSGRGWGVHTTISHDRIGKRAMFQRLKMGKNRHTPRMSYSKMDERKITTCSEKNCDLYISWSCNFLLVSVRSILLSFSIVLHIFPRDVTLSSATAAEQAGDLRDG